MFLVFLRLTYRIGGFCLVEMESGDAVAHIAVLDEENVKPLVLAHTMVGAKVDIYVAGTLGLLGVGLYLRDDAHEGERLFYHFVEVALVGKFVAGNGEGIGITLLRFSIAFLRGEINWVICLLKKINIFALFID